MFTHVLKAHERLTIAIAALILLSCTVGCSERESVSPAATFPSHTSPADALNASDLDRFLAVLDSQSGLMIPEFAAPDDNELLDHGATAESLVGAFRERLRLVFDPERQGALWNRDPDWSEALAHQNISPVEFATLVRSVSCAIMRVRLEKRVDLEQLVNNARADVERLKQSIDEIDEIPRSVRSRDDELQRQQAVFRLGRGVALLEFAEMVKQVPQGSCAVVRQYARRLKPLLPPRSNDDLLAELEQLGSAPPNRVQQAGFERPAPR